MKKSIRRRDSRLLRSMGKQLFHRHRPQVKRVFPFSKWWPTLIGALVGVCLRLVFSGTPGFPFAAMDQAFILFVPLAVGAVAVYVAETQSRRSWSYYMSVGAITNIFFVLGTLLILIEGLICAVIILPLFIVIGAIGGLIMGAICRATNWPRHAVFSFAVLPLALGALPVGAGSNQHLGVVERTIVITAPANSVWHQLHNVDAIRPEEVDRAWMYRIGVPLPISGVTQVTPAGLVRKIEMGKSIHFDQISTEWLENRYVKWRYRFQEDSFPPNALDDHVKIGGHYFDIIDTEYTLAPAGLESTSLSIRIHYRVSTDFNWYADPVAQFLIGNFEEVILGFYAHRSIGA